MKCVPIATVALFLAVAAHAQTYPVKPVRILVGFTPGAGVDIAMRLIAPKMGEALGQQVVIDNRAGAGGNIAGEIVAKSPPDGYTLLGGGAPQAISQTLYPRLGYDVLRDFEMVALVASVSQILVVHPSLPARTVKDFVAVAKSSRDELSYASTGAGSTPHLAAELLRLHTGIRLLHVPYKGTPQAVTDLLAGHVTFMFANVLSALPHVQSGRLRALAITTAKRSAITPNLPTVAETYPGYESGSWYGLAAPAGTPKEAVSRLNEAVARTMQLPEIREKFLAQGAEPLAGSPQDAAAYMRAEVAKWGKVVRASGARVD